ncbi:MAG TPA: VOC family protein [Vibrio sp.]|uniref:SMU1112c/YaeR family gloxylase I-like metalloprotein n=1 Tax=Vibrio TaxID=662 RepID=UPI000EE0A7AD|nr:MULTISPECIES: VOC family protein [Vibrio]HCH01849.1 VOC family protein [Vibrio sp.]
MFNQIDHVAIICSDYVKSKHFYSETLQFKIVEETYREARDSYKLDLQVSPTTQIELFSFPNPPERVDRPEACGLRHLAFAVDDIEQCIAYLESHNVVCEPIRVDELTGKQFTFFKDPDGLPLELYQS